MIGDKLRTAAKVASVEEGWDLANAVYNDVYAFNIAAQETNAQGIFFKPDGTKMYIIGTGGDSVNEYNLSTAWDVSTASYVQLFSVAAQETFPTGLFFKPDGTKMYVIGQTGDDVNEYNLSTAWDVSTASFVQVFSVGAEEPTPTGLFFKPDGTKMYIIGSIGDSVNEYNLSTAWDVSTATYYRSVKISSQEITPTGLFFKPDGTKMYVVGQAGDDVNEYVLSVAWDISTAIYSQNFSFALQTISPEDIFFKPDGKKLYLVASDRQAVFSYDL